MSPKKAFLCAYKICAIYNIVYDLQQGLETCEAFN